MKTCAEHRDAVRHGRVCGDASRGLCLIYLTYDISNYPDPFSDTTYAVAAQVMPVVTRTAVLLLAVMASCVVYAVTW
jgi:hypothetical protein